MKTIKRVIPDIDTTVGNYNKYFNQMEFNGIKEDDNIYTIDQKSLRDSNNIFVDWNNRLVSRPTLQIDNTLPVNVVPTTFELIDIFDFDVGKVYISKSSLSNTYTVIAKMNETVVLDEGASFSIEGLASYNISIIEHYVICFNNVNAKIIDTNNPEAGWQLFTNFAEVPITKRVVSDSITTYNKNEFIPNLYKEEYIVTSQFKPVLPASNAAKTVTINNKLGSFEFAGVLNLDRPTFDYRLLRPVNHKERDYWRGSIKPLISAAKGTLCIATDKYFKCSRDYGKNFTTIYYPTYTGSFLHTATVSKDGNYFFFIARDGVYRCNLADYTWSIPFASPFDGTNTNIKGYRSIVSTDYYCCFLTGDTFAFMTFDSSVVATNYLYFKGPGLYSGNDYTNDHMDPSNSNYYELQYITTLNWPNAGLSLYDLFQPTRTTNYDDRKMVMSIVKDYNNREVATITIVTNKYDVYNPLQTDNEGMIFIYGGDTSATSTNITMWTQYTNIYINLVDRLLHIQMLSTIYYTDNPSVEIECLVVKENFENVYLATINIGNILGTPNATYTENEEVDTFGSIYNNIIRPISENIYLRDDNIQGVVLYDKITDNIDFALKVFTSGYLYEVIIDGNTYYQICYNTNWTGYDIWTNNLGTDDSASIVYTIGRAGTFTSVPQVTYSDTELYLAFNNLLQITSNIREGVDISFNLPKINNQSFIDNITVIKNISTKDIAIFFNNKIIICSKVDDENLGFRYDYYNTKLSTGVRLGDSVINTLEGSYTIFPTLRGLASMNYQAFMATTDQVLTYITDEIRDLWTLFYKASITSGQKIKIIQWRNWLVLTNNSQTLLLYDLLNNTWWKWTLPINVIIAISDQVDLKVINSTLLIFKSASQYYDFSETGNFTEIDWTIISQPLHMNAPNNYKNLKQLIFQFADTENTTVSKTINAQIKLYRKKITIREPEIIQFKIEELRTFVKRFNYWKINEVQWGLSNDNETNIPKRFELDGISVKYEIGEEVK